MMKRYIFAILAVGILTFGYVLYAKLLDDQRRTVSTAINQEHATTETATAYTPTQVREHDSVSDCWTIIEGNVYDLTSYIDRHPGGTEIERACGKDASELFTTRQLPDGQPIGSGSAHSDAATEQLESLKIGAVRD